MKRFFLSSLASTILVAGVLATPVYAQGGITSRTGLDQAAGPTGLVNACSGGTGNCVATVVGRLINVALGFIGIVLLVLFIYAGFLWMTAGGDMDKVKHARTMIMNAVAGLVVIGLSYALTAFVLSNLETAIGAGGGTAGGESASTTAP